MNELLTQISTNWKTTATGITLIGVTVAFIMGRLTLNEYLGISGMLAGGGLMLAHDAKIEK